MTEYERKFIVNPFLKEDCETERKRWYNLFEEPFELFQRFNFELHYLLGSIKGIEKDQSTKDALEDRLIIAKYTFSDIDFLKKIANLLISCGKSDTAKTFDHVRWMREEISYAISYYREHFSAIHLINKEVIRPFIYMYVRLDFLSIHPLSSISCRKSLARSVSLKICAIGLNILSDGKSDIVHL